MAAERQQQEEAEAALEREAEEFKKQLPRGFHDVLVNVARSVILHQPKDPLLYCAQFLEAEIDRRVLSDLAYCTYSGNYYSRSCVLLYFCGIYN